MHKLGVIVPYRNREKQLKLFLKEIKDYLDKSLEYEYCIIIVDQIDKKKFNRGKLLNIGFLEAIKRGCDYVVFHDVDMLPVECDYTYSGKPLQLANHFISDGDFNRSIQRNYFGGVTLFSVKDFQLINGYSNRYKGWGFEDDDLLLRCRELNLNLENESYRTVNIDKRAMYFSGKKSFIKIENKYRTVRPYSYLVTFFPDVIDCDPSEITDEFAIFGIPGHDLNLSFNSFSRYKFELFLKDNTPVSITSDFIPNLPLQVFININPKLNRAQYFINGKEVGTKYWGNRALRLYEEEPYLYLGVADPTRNKKQKYFKGYISNFGIINGELSLEEIRKLFMSDPNKPINETNDFIKDRWYAYFDSINFSKLKNKLIDTSGGCNDGEIHNVSTKYLTTSKVSRLKFPYRRKGVYKLLRHSEGGYVDGYWKDWNSRENQLRYYRLTNSGSSNYSKDGLSTCKYRSNIKIQEDNYIKIDALT